MWFASYVITILDYSRKRKSAKHKPKNENGGGLAMRVALDV